MWRTCICEELSRFFLHLSSCTSEKGLSYDGQNVSAPGICAVYWSTSSPCKRESSRWSPANQVVVRFGVTTPPNLIHEPRFCQWQLVRFESRRVEKKQRKLPWWLFTGASFGGGSVMVWAGICLTGRKRFSDLKSNLFVGSLIFCTFWDLPVIAL